MNVNLLRSKAALHGYRDIHLASKLNLSQTAISLKLRGRSEFSRKQISQLSSILNLTPEEIQEIFFKEDSIT